MAYIGQQPVVGRYILLDQISGGFNGTTSGFTMSTAGGVQGVKPGLAQNVLLSLGGVIQQPGVDYTISGSGITFTTPPVSGTTFFATVLGDAQSVGTPSDGTVTPASIASGFDFGFPNVNVTGVTTIASGVAATPSLSITGDADTGIFSPSADTLGFATAGVQRLSIETGEVVVNDGSSDVDFRVESNGQAHMLFVDGGNDRIGIGKSTPRSAFELGIGHIVVPALGRIGNGGSGDTPETAFRFSSADHISAIVGNSEKLRIDNSGRLLVGTTTEGNGDADDLTVATSGNTGITVRSGTANTGNLYFSDATSGTAEFAGAVTYNHSSNELRFRTNTTENLIIDSSGRLLVGTSSDVTGSTHHVVQAVTTGGGRITLARNDTSVTAGDVLGQIGFSGNDANGSFQQVANITCEADGTHGDDDKPGRLRFLVTASGAGSATERMRISNTGNIKLTGGEALFWDDAGDRYIACIGDTTSNINLHGRANVIFKTGGSSYDGGTERMRIDSSGNVGIGTSSPTEKLSINGNLQFEANDGVSIGAKESLIVNLNSSGGQSGRVFQINDNGTSRVVFQQAGNVGIGTTSPSQLVTLSSGSDTQLLLTTTNNTAHNRINFTNSGSSASGGLWYGSSNTMEFRTNDTERMRIESTGIISLPDDAAIAWGSGSGRPSIKGNNSSDFLQFNVTGSERMRIDSSGNVGIGTTTIHARLSVNGTLRFQTGNNPVALLTGDGDGTNCFKIDSNSVVGNGSGLVRFFNNATQKARIEGDGSFQSATNSYGALSDVNLKENIVDADIQWNDIKNIQVRNFNFKEAVGHGTSTQLGVIAQEVESVSPGLVKIDSDGVKSVKYSVLYMKAVKALQEAMDRIETLETSNADLLARVTALES